MKNTETSLSCGGTDLTMSGLTVFASNGIQVCYDFLSDEAPAGEYLKCNQCILTGTIWLLELCIQVEQETGVFITHNDTLSSEPYGHIKSTMWLP